MPGDSLIENKPSVENHENEEYFANFFQKEICTLSQEEINKKVRDFISFFSKNPDVDYYDLVVSNISHEATPEEIQSGQSSYAKLYRALVEASSSQEAGDVITDEILRQLQDMLIQNPQVIGPVAMLQMARDFMWRKDIYVQSKDGFMSGMTYALAYLKQDRYREELLKQLDFENEDQYSQTAHMLEAIKGFWIHGHKGYAEDKVPAFYIDTLERVEEGQDSNFLLSTRAREILALLRRSSDFPNERRDKGSFEISQGQEALFENGRDLMILSQDGEASSVEDVVSGYKNLSEQEMKEFIFDYEYLMSRPIREMIQREFGFELKDLSLQEQFFILNYLKTISNREAGFVKAFSQKYGTTGFRAFLSLQHNRELGNEIIVIGHELPQQDAQAIFEKYSEIVDVANDVENYIRENVTEENFEQSQVDKVRDNVLRRGTDLLLGFSKKVREAHGRGEVVDSEEIKNQLETFKSESILFASTFKGLKESLKEGEDVFEIMKNVSFETVKGEDFSEADKVAMRNIFDQNYANNPDFKKVVKESFERRLINPEVDFYVVRDEGRIISFLSTEPSHSEKTFHQKSDREVGENEIYFGSFNSFNGYKGGSIGDAMMRKVLDKEAETKIIHADCPATDAIGSKYIEDGFFATRYYQYAGKPSLEITRDDSLKFQSRDMSREEIVGLYLRHSLDMSRSNGDLIIKRADFQKDLDFSDLSESFVLTRYFKFTNDSKWYVVFEKVDK